MTDYLIIILVVVAIVIIWLTRSREAGNIDGAIASLEKSQERLERIVKEEVAVNRTELQNSLRAFGDTTSTRIAEIGNQQKNQLDTFSNQLTNLTQMNEQKLDKLRETVDNQLKSLQEDNSKKLEQMRQTVDEKLHATLEKRLGESFQQVSERLELVHKGLGEMQTLASGVGDLKKVLTNVKSRGTWGEIQLGSLLEQILTKEQYAKNVATKSGSNDRVEYAIRLPGKDEYTGEVWLPIDAKFPMEDYQKLVDAQELADLQLIDVSAKQLENRIKAEAKNIKSKYIDPPNTTDFAIMYLPVEGLYAEVIRRAGLVEALQNECRVTIAGPTNLTAFLNSLQMGFRTLAIEKRSSEVWELLGAVKTEFGKFGDILEKTHKKLQEASNTIDNAARKSRTIERRLKGVQELPSAEATTIIGEIETEIIEEAEFDKA